MQPYIRLARPTYRSYKTGAKPAVCITYILVFHTAPCISQVALKDRLIAEIRTTGRDNEEQGQLSPIAGLGVVARGKENTERTLSQELSAQQCSIALVDMIEPNIRGRARLYHCHLMELGCVLPLTSSRNETPSRRCPPKHALSAKTVRGPRISFPTPT